MNRHPSTDPKNSHPRAAALNQAMARGAVWGRREIVRENKATAQERAGLVRDGSVLVSVTGRDGGTEATRQRIKPCPVADMLARGHLTQEQHNAAIRIRVAVGIITTGLGAQISTYGLSVGGPSDGDYESVWAIDVQAAYNDWVDAMAERAVANARSSRAGNRWKLWLPLDVVVEGQSCREIAEQRGMDRGTVMRYLRDALDLYIETSRQRRTQRRRVEISA